MKVQRRDVICQNDTGGKWQSYNWDPGLSLLHINLPPIKEGIRQ